MYSYLEACQFKLTPTFCGGTAGNPGLLNCPGPGNGVGGNPPGGGGRPTPTRGGRLGA